MVGFIQVIPYSRMFLSIPSDLASVPDMLFLHFGEQFLRFFFCFFFFCLFFWLHRGAGGILVSQPGNELMSPALGAES